jgi:hypothetical protein
LHRAELGDGKTDSSCLATLARRNDKANMGEETNLEQRNVFPQRSGRRQRFALTSILRANCQDLRTSANYSSIHSAPHFWHFQLCLLTGNGRLRYMRP